MAYTNRTKCKFCGTVLESGHRVIGVCNRCVYPEKEEIINIPIPTYRRAYESERTDENSE